MRALPAGIRKMRWLWLYIAAINLIGFFMMAADKQKAIRSKPRISENALFSAAWMGGSPGVFLGIFAFRHKTKHKKFTVGLPFVMAAQVVCFFLLDQFLFA